MKDDEEIYAEDNGRRYKLMTLPHFIRFRDLAFSEGGWKTHYTDSQLTVQSRPPGDDSTSLNIIRARRVMERVPPLVLYNQLHDAEYRATWDTNMIEGYNICILDRHNDVGYYSAKFPWPLANRDFCNQRSWMEFTNGEYVIFNHSEPHELCPEKKKFVRAKSILTGFFIQPHGEGTLLTYVTHSDPCGSIPHAIINFAMTKGAPMILNNCEKCSEKYPDFAKATYPPDHVYPWTTPKMDWDSTYLYPEHELAAKQAGSTEPVAGAEVPTGTLAATAAPSGGTAVGGEAFDFNTAPVISLAPMAAAHSMDAATVQQYRSIMQDAMNAVDRSFLREGRAPTTEEYMVRLKFSVEGVRQTLLRG